MKNFFVFTFLHTFGAYVFAQDPDACKLKSGILEDPTYCDRFFECFDGKSVRRDCPNGLVFTGRRRRGLLGGCEYAWQTTNACEGKQLANGPIKTDHCDWLYGIFGHETSCTRYWTCWNGTATEQFCIGGLLYNEETRACDWPENVQGCQKHPLCKEDPNGNVPLGKSCNRYWHCQGGYPRLQRCPSGLVFDKLTLGCVIPPTEDCEATSTTIAPPEEDTGEGRNSVDANQRQNQVSNRQQQSPVLSSVLPPPGFNPNNQQNQQFENQNSQQTSQQNFQNLRNSFQPPQAQQSQQVQTNQQNFQQVGKNLQQLQN